MRRNKQTTGIVALGMSERYPKSRLALVNEKYKPLCWWEQPFVSILLIIIFVVGDYANIYMILSDVLNQNPVVLFLFAAVLCLLFNFLPIIFARIIRLRKAEMLEATTAYLVVIPIVLLLLIASIWWVRFSTRNLEFQNASLLHSIASGNSNQTSSSPAALPMVNLMSALPIATATVSFFIAWLDDPLKQKAHALERYRTKIFENLVQLKAFMAEFGDRQYEAQLMLEDAEKFGSVMNAIEAEKRHQKNYFRTRLASRLGDPTATSILSASQNSNDVASSDKAKSKSNKSQQKNGSKNR